ncbi:hypothetical protein HPHPH9_1600 [Helicobacter pylori Hp H-9]|nr:hypothetical protein HPHPH9_1600 [Helicobacter pylori Hp H-9]
MLSRMGCYPPPELLSLKTLRAFSSSLERVVFDSPAAFK